MDAFTPFRVLGGNIAGLIHYLSFVEKRHAESTPRLFVDITEVHIHDNGTGVPRVTNGIRHNLSKFNLPYKIIEVYAKPHNQGFFDAANDKPIKIAKGDFFFSLDFSKFKIPQNKSYIKKMKKLGIPCWFFLHDMIPISHPQYCKAEDISSFKKWIDIVKNFDGFIANSRSTEDEMKAWLKTQLDGTYNKNIRSGYIHIASTFKQHETELTSSLEKSGRLQFLAVSTVEPRKRYDLIVEAFTRLWKENIDVSLHIVGKPGWNNEKVIQQIRSNAEYGKRLVWHDKFISDEELGRLYAESAALIFASDTEGFGVPLIEAACYGKSLIVRDIPIFREVTNGEATFFKGDTANDLANAIKDWIPLYKLGKVSSPSIKLYTWKESTAETIKILMADSRQQTAELKLNCIKRQAVFAFAPGTYTEAA